MLAALAIGASLAALPALAQPISTEQIKAIVASPDRTPADLTNDKRRHPEDILAFLALKPGLVALDVSAGGGYTTELLARAIGPTGKVYGQSRPRPATPPPAPTNARGQFQSDASPRAPPPSGPPRPSPVALADRESRMKAANVAAAPITRRRPAVRGSRRRPSSPTASSTWSR